LADGNDAPSTFVLPDYPELLNDHTFSLNDVVRVLLVPPFGGFYLSRDTIAQTGRRLNLPVGFGSREELLSTLLRSAGQYELAPAALDALHNITLVWQAEYVAIKGQWPLLTPYTTPWRIRAAETGDLLIQFSGLL
jgi:hypothetical protein